MNSPELIIEIQKACSLMRKVLDREVVSGDIEAINQKLLDLTMLEGLSSETIARAKKVLHFKELTVLNEMIGQSMAPSVQTQSLKSKCYEELALVAYTDRLNAGIHHSQDALRTIISLYKEEMRGSMQP